MSRVVCCTIFLSISIIVIATVSYFGYLAYRRAITVDCESYEVMNRWDERLLQVEVCLMNEKTAINTSGIEIFSKNLRVRNLTMSSNPRIFYLPENVHKSFPNLVILEAENCRIKEISKNNFRGLTRLKILKLAFNMIASIDAGIFYDNRELQYIDLSELTIFDVYNSLQCFFFHFSDSNHLKYIDIRSFNYLYGLTELKLKHNKCIDREFKLLGVIVEESLVTGIPYDSEFHKHLKDHCSGIRNSFNDELTEVGWHRSQPQSIDQFN